MDAGSPPSREQGLREQGIRALQEGDLDDALDLLAGAVVADGRDAEAKAYLAVAYSRKGLHAQARRTIQTALELQPANPQFRYQLGTIREREGDTEAAAAAYREVLRGSPEHTEAAARLELMGLKPLKPDAEPLPAPAPQPAPQPGPAPPPAVAPASATAGARGTMQCPKCLEWSKPGLSCEWCAGPLMPRPAPPVPPPYAVPPYAPQYPATMQGPAPTYPQAYMPPGGMPAPGYPMPGFGYRKAHRGGSILTLGILGLVFTLLGLGCPPSALPALVCGIVAWVMGNSDLAEMDAGVMDDYGRGSASAGRVMGIIATSISVVLTVGWLLLILFLSSFAG